MDVLGRVDEPAGRRRQLYQQLAARAARRQSPDGERVIWTRRRASSSCWRASARWSGTIASPEAARRQSRRAGERSAAGLGCDAVAARRRSSTSGSSPRSDPRPGRAGRVVTAHYGVEGAGFYGIPLAKWLPYAVARTWHTQLGHLLDRHRLAGHRAVHRAGVSGYEPRAAARRERPVRRAAARRRRLDRPASGSRIHNKCSGTVMVLVRPSRATSTSTSAGSGRSSCSSASFLWLVLMWRALWPALREDGESEQLAGAASSSPRSRFALFYGAGLMWDSRRTWSIAEYWRWWVVHLWVEGFFEVFATVVIAFLFTRMRLLRPDDGDARRCSSRPSSSCRAASSARSIISTSRARRPSCWPAARCSAPSRSCRWCWSASRR